MMFTSGERPLRPPTVLHELFARPATTTSQALDRAAERARELGFVVLQLGLQSPGDVNEIAKFHAAIALQCVRDGNPMAPTLMLSGGALLAKAGRATHAEFVLALALALDGHRAIYAYACGPDAATDGATASSVQMGPDTLARARQLRIDTTERLARCDARSVFDVLGDCEPLALAAAPACVLRAILVTQQ